MFCPSCDKEISFEEANYCHHHITGVMVHIQTVSVEFSGIDNLFDSGILCGISLFYNNNNNNNLVRAH